jgi:hypothetical protein
MAEQHARRAVPRVTPAKRDEGLLAATRNGRSINYHTVWTFRFADAVVAEAWLQPSLPGDEIRRFYGFDRA